MSEEYNYTKSEGIVSFLLRMLEIIVLWVVRPRKLCNIISLMVITTALSTFIKPLWLEIAEWYYQNSIETLLNPINWNGIILLLFGVSIALCCSLWRHRGVRKAVTSSWWVSMLFLMGSLAVPGIWIIVAQNDKTVQQSNEKFISSTFRLKNDVVSVKIGTNTVSATRKSLMNRPMFPFAIDDYFPIKMTVKDDKFYVNLDIIIEPGKPRLKLEYNELSGLPDDWDFNYNLQMLEIVNENKVPVYQVSYEDDNNIVFSGIFMYEGQSLFVNKGEVSFNPPLPYSFSIKRIFKYPSRWHKSQLETSFGTFLQLLLGENEILVK